MSQMGIPAKLVRIIRAYTYESKSKVSFGGEVSNEFPVTIGLRKEDALSPALFNIAHGIPWAIFCMRLIKNLIIEKLKYKKQENNTHLCKKLDSIGIKLDETQDQVDEIKEKLEDVNNKLDKMFLRGQDKDIKNKKNLYNGTYEITIDSRRKRNPIDLINRLKEKIQEIHEDSYDDIIEEYKFSNKYINSCPSDR
ncbi:Domain of unknown function DUF3627 [Cinara cedri]|uniref:DUF3627 domain-containing protein n=1 Tax=Cinara cedri TaxID=506608 RepID=A0A5E4MYN1_9HEMI|nr:Domain of unknown function DUF3627 [Cinara cedri]